MSNPNQAEFDATYITSSEIRDIVDVKRSSMTIAIQYGNLPPPISVYGTRLHVWKRDEVMPYVNEWLKKLKARRGY